MTGLVGSPHQYVDRNVGVLVSPLPRLAVPLAASFLFADFSEEMVYN